MTEPSELSPETCRTLLDSTHVGRVALSTPLGPRIVAVDYAMVGGAIVFRAAFYSVLGTYAANTALAFEIDGVDADEHLAWSVGVLGRGGVVGDPQEAALITRVWDPPPSGGSRRWRYFKLVWTELSGRRLGDDPR